MKMKLALAAIAVLTLPLVAAQAQQNPRNPPPDLWCRDQPLDRSSIQICSAYTYQQCMASRTSHTESCYLNPRYDARFRRN